MSYFSFFTYSYLLSDNLLAEIKQLVKEHPQSTVLAQTEFLDSRSLLAKVASI